MRRSPGEARLLGLWTAGCLAVLLLAGILWVGDLTLQWPVFVVPLGWAMLAARPRRGAVRPSARADDPRAAPPGGYDPRAAPPDRYDGHPATREAPTLPPLPPGRHPGER
ncbi:hypothetical protein [Trujillonella endophytica]|uniref:Uncharacterized protein n=1 Tax=Trujillonella endophytica TaxID=673521 RepID=A0A1H8SJY1_9ACTN|nr:hypothetical protein [Trujillella endophytica]SEO78588.1 hypothetical protein SAMN05660991_01759 [Trujillella endophytica]